MNQTHREFGRGRTRKPKFFKFSKQRLPNSVPKPIGFSDFRKRLLRGPFFTLVGRIARQNWLKRKSNR
jgi:hypothetical protein